MYSTVSKTCSNGVLKSLARNISTSQCLQKNVAVMGASGGIGQPLSMLLKMNPDITQLSLYDIVHTPGVAADLSHIDTKAKVNGFVGEKDLDRSLAGADIVVIPAGVPRKPGMTRDDLFNTNASIVANICTVAAEVCPDACIAIISNPVNSTVPIAAEIFKKFGTFNPKKVFGVTTLDVIRANAFIAEKLNLDPKTIECPVIGGHAGITIMPILSNVKEARFSQEEIESLTARIQDAGTEVVKAKDGAGSATLSMACAAARFTNSLIKALNGEPNVYECAYVASDVTEAKFFSTPLLLSKNGIERNCGLPQMNAYEESLLKAAIPELNKTIKNGEDFVTKNY